MKRGILKVLPEGILAFIGNKMKPKVLCKYINKDNGEIKGYGVGIITTYKNIRKEVLIDRIVATLGILEEDNIDNIIVDKKDLLESKDIYTEKELVGKSISDGRKVRISLAIYILKKIFSYYKDNLMYKQSLMEQEVLIIGDDTKDTRAIVLKISEDLKYLTVLGNDDSFMEKLEKDVLLATGLSIYTTKDIGAKIGEYNIIINLSEDVEIDIKQIRKRTIMIDLGRGMKLSNKTKNIRQDLLMIEDLIFKKPQNIECEIMEFDFPNEIESSIYELISEVNEKDLIKIKINDRVYTIKEAIKSYLRQRSNLSIFNDKCK